MKRRDFLIVSGGIAAAVASRYSAAQNKPCPPPSLGVAGGSSVSTTCLANGNAPAWFIAMSDRHWAQPVTNWLGAVKDPLMDSTNAGNSEGAIVRAFSGMGTDRVHREIFLMGNGGHSDYHGNEVYSCDLSVAAPAWQRRRNASVHSGSGDVTKYSDGRKSSDHTGDLTMECGGRWFTPGMGGTDYNGDAAQGQWWEFDRNANDYIDRGGNHPSNNGGTTSVSAVSDAANGQFLVVHSGNGTPSIEFIRLSDLAQTSVNNNGLPTGGGAPAALDTTNRILLVKDDNASTKYWWVNIGKNPTAAWTALNASGAGIPNTQAFHWHEPSGAFLTWDRGGGLIKGTPTLGGGGYSSLVWSTVASAGGTAPVFDSLIAGMHNKVGLIPDMGNGQACLVVVPQWGTPDVHIFKIPVAGV